MPRGHLPCLRGDNGHLSYDCNQEFAQAQNVQPEQGNDKTENADRQSENTEGNANENSPTVKPTSSTVSPDNAQKMEEEIPLHTEQEITENAEEMDQDPEHCSGVK